MLKQFVTVLCLVLMATSCHKLKAPKKPDNLISKEKMVDILIDAKLIASASSANRRIMAEHGIDIKTYVYQKHNIDSLQFVLSNDYYAFYIKDYEAIYNKVEDSLEALRAKYKDLDAQEWKEKTKREEDSLKAVYARRDSIITAKDTLKNPIVLDSLNRLLLKKKFEEEGGLVAPISDTDSQSKQ
ncbi:DUF4296 domain-containing protein [Sabulilitoribacter multivorans]|uniref:DUF4296 domain-containing protein n=1 Tax=Flaviramulus multivorans TaxID=1304750 RepID=A0ABS9IGZ6_9FLAO|nr:DUF4296 domain-containing protein [Flaviramulus multivorans]MCF7559890.1 DUF4296 domain-containing protein [Flaviramulus multivorans]